MSASDIARFYPHQMRREHTRLRTTEAFIKTYGIVHPAEQYESDRDQRLSPMHESEVKLGARFFEAVGWERPQWYESNADLLEVYGDAVMPREHEWDSRWWSPIVNAEHLRMREAAGVIDLTAFAVFDITGPGALDAVQRTCVAQCDVAVGKVIYTPVLDHKGGFRSDLTVMRLGEDHFRVVTGGAHGMADRKWFADQLPADGSAELTDHTDELSTIGLWGPRARDILSSLTSDDVSDEGFGFLTCREITVRTGRTATSPCWRPGSPTSASSAGSSTCRWPTAPRCGTRCSRPAPRTAPARSASASTRPPAASRRATARSATSSTASARSSRPGMQRPKVKAADFVGREAYLAQREQAPATVLCTLTVDDHTSASGVKRYMLGGEPILTRDGGTLTDGHGHHPYVTTAGSAPSLGKHVLLAYLPPAEATDRQPARGLLHGGALPGHRRLGRQHAAARPGERADPLMSNVLVCIKRVPDLGGEITADRRRHGRRRLGRWATPSARTRSARSSWPSRWPRTPTARRPC